MSASVRAPSKKTSQKWSPPVISTSGRISMPGYCRQLNYAEVTVYSDASYKPLAQGLVTVNASGERPGLEAALAGARPYPDASWFSASSASEDRRALRQEIRTTPRTAVRSHCVQASRRAATRRTPAAPKAAA
jgi:hypothetical protein